MVPGRAAPVLQPAGLPLAALRSGSRGAGMAVALCTDYCAEQALLLLLLLLLLDNDDRWALTGDGGALCQLTAGGRRAHWSGAGG